MVLSDGLRCYECGAQDVVLVDPGSAPIIHELTGIMLARGRPAQATCLMCWPMVYRYQQELVRAEVGCDACSPVRKRSPRAASRDESLQDSLF